MLIIPQLTGDSSRQAALGLRQREVGQRSTMMTQLAAQAIESDEPEITDWAIGHMEAWLDANSAFAEELRGNRGS
jgi:hypothetical protein